MQVSPPGSGTKFRNTIFNQDKMIPKCDPCDPIYPEGSGRSLPTAPTEKFLMKNLANARHTTHEYTYTKEPIIHKEYEHVKKAAIPTQVDELERLRLENSQLRDQIQVLLVQTNSSKTTEEERVRLIEEINRLRLRVATLEAQLEDQKGFSREKDELYKVIEGLRYRVKELETSGLRTSQLSDYERKTLDSQKLKIIDYENKTVLFMIEIERLGKIIAEIQLENDQLTLQSSQNELRDKLRAFESEKFVLKNQNREHLLKIEEYESRISFLKLDLEKQKGNTSSAAQMVLIAAEIERLTLLLEDKTREIEQLKETSNDPITIHRIKADYEESMKALLAENARMKNDYEENIRILFAENASLSERYRLLESARLSEIQNIVTQNATLSKQINITNTDSLKLISAIRELENEHKSLGDKYHRILNELEEARRTQTITVVNIDQSPTKRALRDSLSEKIQSIGFSTTQTHKL